MKISCNPKRLLQGATFTLAATLLVLTINASAGNSKVVICHIPPGNPDQEQPMSVPPSAVGAHLGHGDHLGVCNPEPPQVEEINTGLAF